MGESYWEIGPRIHPQKRLLCEIGGPSSTRGFPWDGLRDNNAISGTMRTGRGTSCSSDFPLEKSQRSALKGTPHPAKSDPWNFSSQLPCGAAGPLGCGVDDGFNASCHCFHDFIVGIR